MSAARLRVPGARVAAIALVVVALLAPIAAVSTPAEAARTNTGWLRTSGSTIVTASGDAHVIKAVAWFGMETETCAPHGLWSIGLSQGLASIASMGFNAIRLPFSNECLARTASSSIDYGKNPGLRDKSPLQIMDTVIAQAERYGVNVILDRHRPESSAQSPLWYTAAVSERRWISDWVKLARRYAKQSNVVGFDLHNEPHGEACWGCGDVRTDWRIAARRAGNAILKVNPKVLIIVEGTDAGAVGYTWWGGGLAGVAAKPVTLRVKNRVVYSPHDYPSTIYGQSWFAHPAYPRNLPRVWNANWGYIDKRGIAPVLLGEFGTKLETASDRQWLRTLVDYLRDNTMSFAYWSFNPNSGDTGGLVADDWVTRQSAKLSYLRPLIGRGKTVRVLPEPGSSTINGPSTLGPTPTITQPPTDIDTDTGVETGTVTLPPTGVVVSARTDAGFSAEWTMQSAWQTGYTAAIRVASTQAISRWTVTWKDTTATSIASSWGMDCTIDRGRSITCTGSGWAQALSPGASAQVGLNVVSTGPKTVTSLEATAR